MNQQVRDPIMWQRWLQAIAACAIAMTIVWMATVAGMVSQHLHAQTFDLLTSPHSAVPAHPASAQATTDKTLVERLCEALRDCPCSSAWNACAELGAHAVIPVAMADWPPSKKLDSVVHDVPDPPPEMALASTGEGHAATVSPRSDG